MNDSEILAEVRRWMRFAQEDLATAQALINLPDYVPRNVCYLSQQAVEKALKAALIFARVRIPAFPRFECFTRATPSRLASQTRASRPSSSIPLRGRKPVPKMPRLLFGRQLQSWKLFRMT